MNINSILNTMMSEDSVKGVADLVGVSSKDVQSVLSSALPALLDGAKGQANDAGTAEGFAGALADHAKADTGNISSFLSGVDLEDGGKIVSHLLGGKKEDTTQKAAQKAGVDAGKPGNILSAAAPLLMSLLGQQTASEGSSNNASGIGGLMGNLLGSVDVGSLLGGLLGGSSSSGSSASNKKKKKKKNDDGNVLSGLLDLFKG